MGLIRGRPRSDSHPLAAVTITSGATAAEKNTIDVTSTATKARETFGERPISTSACTALAVASKSLPSTPFSRLAKTRSKVELTEAAR